MNSVGSLETQQYSCVCYTSIYAELFKHQDRDFPSANNKRIQNCKEENSLRLTLGRMSREEKLVILCAGFVVMSDGRMCCQERPES
jgi:hypothetical protein